MNCTYICIGQNLFKYTGLHRGGGGAVANLDFGENNIQLNIIYHCLILQNFHFAHPPSSACSPVYIICLLNDCGFLINFNPIIYASKKSLTLLILNDCGFLINFNPIINASERLTLLIFNDCGFLI